jgi:hypothetical protein
VLLQDAQAFSYPKILIIERISSKLGYLFTNAKGRPENRRVRTMDENMLISVLRDINRVIIR